MNIDQLMGRQVKIGADDLFDVPLAAVIRAIDSDSTSLLLEFVVLAQIGVETYPFAVARSRRHSDDFDTLLASSVLGCNVTCVPRDRYDSAKPFDLSWWRGGGAAIGDVML